MIKEKILNQIRNRSISTQNFRKKTNSLSSFLAKKTHSKIPKLKNHNIVLVLILRSSIAMLSAFLRYFPTSTIGFIGLKRNEKTAIAKKYYENLPKLNRNSIVIIPDPMLATGGSLMQVIKILLDKGIPAKNVYYTGFIGSKLGVDFISKIIPSSNITLLAVDSKLNNKKYIIPGLGDFGDRYFGN